MKFLRRKVTLSCESSIDSRYKEDNQKGKRVCFKRYADHSIDDESRESRETDKIPLNDRQIIKEDHGAALQYIMYLEEEKQRIPVLERNCLELKKKLVSLGQANDSLKFALKKLTIKHTEYTEMYMVSMAEVRRLNEVNRMLVKSIGMLEQGNNVMDQNILHDMSALSCFEKQHIDGVSCDNHNWPHIKIMKSLESSSSEGLSGRSIRSDISIESGSILDATCASDETQNVRINGSKRARSRAIQGPLEKQVASVMSEATGMKTRKHR